MLIVLCIAVATNIYYNADRNKKTEVTMEYTEFKGKCAIATGAASGMGLLFAQNFAALGGNVVLYDVNEQVLIEKVAEINEKNQGKAIGVVCDD